MISTASALQEWFSQFGWPVFGAGDVPANAQLPYITVPVKESEWDRKCPLHVKLWAYTKENRTLLEKSDQIVAAVGVGVRIPCNGGIIVLWPDNPIEQIMTSSEGNVRGMLIMLQMNAYHCPGG